MSSAVSPTDSFEAENHIHSNTSWVLVLTALGIVYGDIGTSPLYALREAFHGPHAIAISNLNIYGVLSLITWALIIIVSVKYLQFVMRADNKGEGGVLALTALTALRGGKPMRGHKFFLYFGLLGATFMVADSMVTPSISVLSAVEGLQLAAPHLEPFILPITFIILVGLFYFQHKGTAQIGTYFGPIMVTWFVTIGVLGIYSIVQSPEIFLALNPYYAIQFWQHDPKIALIAMSAVFLVCTGGEALYADMGHLGRKAISRGWFLVALPSLLLNYYGQGALLLRDASAYSNPFYLMAPDWAIMPLVAVATLATIIASQAVISGFFSLAGQCVQLGYSPRLKIEHTSETALGQIYVPAINWLALIGALWLVIEFKNSSSLAAAYGISVSFTMVVTTILTAVVAYQYWHWSSWRIGLIFLTFLFVDCIFLGANLLKLLDGGWVVVLIAVVTFTLITTWKKGRKILFDRLRERSYPIHDLLRDIQKTRPARVSGTAVYMVGDVHLTPPTLIHNIKHNKVLHESVVFLTFVSCKVARVTEAERIKINKIADGFFQVISLYGFKETPQVMPILETASKLNPEFKLSDPTFFLGREILVAGKGKEMSFWRKILFSVMAKNATTANDYFQLPLDRVIEVGMQIEL